MHISEKNFEKNLWSFEKVSKSLWSFPNYSGNVSQKNGAGKQKYANKKLSIKLISSFIAVLAREYLMDDDSRVFLSHAWGCLFCFFSFLSRFPSSLFDLRPFPVRKKAPDCYDIYIWILKLSAAICNLLHLAIVCDSLVRIVQSALKSKMPGSFSASIFPYFFFFVFFLFRLEC